MSEQITVTIGTEQKPIPDFRGFKALRAGKIVARVTDTVQELYAKADDYEAEYKKTHRMRLTREEANLRGWDHVDFHLPEGQAPSPEDFIEIPERPTDEQKFLEVFSTAFELIEKEVVQLLALVLAPNDELERAWEDEANGGVDGYLARSGQRLLFDGNIGQLVDVAVAARKALDKEFEGKSEDLAGLRNLLSQQTPKPQEEKTETDTPTEPTAETPEPVAPEPQSALDTAGTPTRESESGPSRSSTPSDAPTDGAGETPSGASPGSSSAVSSVA